MGERGLKREREILMVLVFRERERDYGSDRVIGGWGFREREILEVKVLEREREILEFQDR